LSVCELVQVPSPAKLIGAVQSTALAPLGAAENRAVDARRPRTERRTGRFAGSQGTFETFDVPPISTLVPPGSDFRQRQK
jgi:hypothetical protein